MTKRKRILFIVSRLPINTQTGDRLRVYHFIKRLAERGHQIDVVGFVPPGDYVIRTDIQAITRHCIGIEKEDIEFENPSRSKQLKLFFSSFANGYPYRVWQWWDDKFINQTQELINNYNYDIIHFSEVVAGLMFANLPEKSKESRLIFDMIDSVALSLNNALSKEVSWLWPFRYIEQKRLKKFERQIIEQVDEAILISNRDKTFLERETITIIPNGITENDLHERGRDIDLLFVGNMTAEPNIDAVFWFVKDIMPKLLDKYPQLDFTIAGANPTASVKALQNDNVTVTGFVEDINVYYRRAKLFVCSMRLGAGQKNKILEAMINHTAVISTTEGNIGVDAPTGAISIADNAKDFSNAIITLLKDEKQRKKIAKNGYDYARQTFSWEKSVDLLEQCYEV